MAHSVVALLDEAHARAVRDLWEEFALRFGTTGVTTVPFPHITLQVFSGVEPAQVVHAVDAVAARHRPLPTRARAYGFFTGPVERDLSVHVAVVRTGALTALHADLEEEVRRTGAYIDGYYDERYWLPHINLADRDLSASRLAAIVQWLALHPPRSWSLLVDNIAVISGEDGERRILHRAELTNGVEDRDVTPPARPARSLWAG
jgi:2'-5' RNA ligase